MEAILSILLTTFILFIVFVLIQQKELNKIKNEDIKDLSEWNCPECGFLVQMGNSCTYCYTKKPSESNIQS